MNISVAQEYVKKIRSCINPNPGFANQLEEYNGILEARYFNTSLKCIRERTYADKPDHKIFTSRMTLNFNE